MDRRDHVQIEWFAGAAWFLGAVEYSNVFHGRRKRRDKRLSRERPEQMYVQQAGFATLRIQSLNAFFGGE